ncbi:MAG TPA: SpoIVB peptidase S55 domain-containing protein, partial [Terracidiphilus sp.]|nr:SpoIVB peptidase S55 domain-containing protein [Terracidiphilus sp.]
METKSKETRRGLPGFALLAMAVGVISPVLLPSQSSRPSATPSAATAEPAQAAPAHPAFFPLNQVRPGLTGTAWTVFQGFKPEPMQVEILGVLRGARGPGQDLILAQLHGDKPEYTGVVEGMSGSPVYIDGKLVGALSYRIGQFTKEPIAGITPIEQMLEVRDIPLRNSAAEDLQTAAAENSRLDGSTMAVNQAGDRPGSGKNPAG